jgi:spermidine synthase
MERVDVVELEPAILKVARDCAPVNRHVLENPKVHITIGDAREVLLTTPQRYDLIFSEPSNPYRAGIASLFTQEFYQAVASRLAEGGIFLQWLQAYEVDSQTVRTAYATMAAVFPSVETRQAGYYADMLLTAASTPIVYDVPALRARVEREPFRTALANVWNVTGLEGLLTYYVANGELTKAVAHEGDDILNTDDRTLI